MKFHINSCFKFKFSSYIKHIKNLILKFIYYKSFNSFLSACLRFLNKFRIIFRLQFLIINKRDIKNLECLFFIRIGFKSKRLYPTHINFDNYLSNKPQFVSHLHKLPLEKKSCQEISIKYFFRYFDNRNLEKIIKSLKKKLIPGGVLKLELNIKEKQEKVKYLLEVLRKNYFFVKNINYFGLKVNGTIEINAIKEIKENLIPKKIPKEKLDEIILILEQNLSLFKNLDNLGILSYNNESLMNFFKKKKLNFQDIRFFDKTESLVKFSQDYFDGFIIVNFIEFLNFQFYSEILRIIRSITKKNKEIFLIIPEKKNFLLKETAHIFDKGILIKILDEINCYIKWINLNQNFNMMQILLVNKPVIPLDKKKEKICLIGNYSLRYAYLNSAWWDSQERAFKELGYNLLTLDIKDHSYNYLLRSIKIFKPDILWVGGINGIDFLRKNSKFFKNSKITVVYWLWDVREPFIFDFGGVIDTMFISSKNEIPIYKKHYNLDRVFYMPTPINPHILHRNKNIKEVYDIGFSGSIDFSKYHKERTLTLKYLSQHFNVKIFNDIYNNLPEYYSKCKIIFGGTPDLKDLELYSSNRLYISLSCGCCYLTNYFKGLEKLAKNEENILWYNNKDELIKIVNKYLSNKNLRENIKINAELLARSKHNYKARILNMLEIINRKTDKFYGFIN